MKSLAVLLFFVGCFTKNMGKIGELKNEKETNNRRILTKEIGMDICVLDMPLMDTYY